MPGRYPFDEPPEGDWIDRIKTTESPVIPLADDDVEEVTHFDPEPMRRHTTPVSGVNVLAQVEAARADERQIERDIMLEAFRTAMIADGTDPGNAYLLAEKLRKWREKNYPNG